MWTLNEHWTFKPWAECTKTHTQRESERQRYGRARDVCFMYVCIYIYGFRLLYRCINAATATATAHHPHTISPTRTRSSIMRVIVFRSGEKYRLLLLLLLFGSHILFEPSHRCSCCCCCCLKYNHCFFSFFCMLLLLLFLILSCWNYCAVLCMHTFFALRAPHFYFWFVFFSSFLSVAFCWTILVVQCSLCTCSFQ